MWSFAYSEEQEIFKKTIRKYFEKEVAPLVDEAEETEIFPVELLKKMGRDNYLCIRYPDEYGGLGVDKITECIFREELSRVSQGVATTWSSHSHLGTYPIYQYGTNEQKEKYLLPAIRGEKIAAFGLTEPNAGSDTKSMKTTAIKKGDHYIIRGSKIFITNAPIADYIIVAAYTNPEIGYKGISLFIVETDTPGFQIARKLKKEGIRSSETAEIFFDDCIVPAENLIGGLEGNFKGVMSTLSEGRIGVAANCVGMAQAALENASQYAKERIQFGQQISNYQAINHKIADMYTEVQASRLLVYQAAWMLDQGIKCDKEASMAKLFASEVAVKAAREAIQIHGGYGSMREYPVGRILRDALVYTVGEGTSEIQKNIIAKQIGLIQKNVPQKTR
jgi:alkylation response protein AidB-like acyl-CoA dehydrogenase